MTYTLKIGKEETKEFTTFTELYTYFDNKVSVYKIDDCKVYRNGKCLGTPTQAYKIISRTK